MINEYIVNELASFLDKFPFCEELKNKSFFITGATGFLGSAFCIALAEADMKYKLNLNIFCYVRDINKARKVLGKYNLQYIVGDLNTQFNLPCHMDYIIHCASPTASEYFIKYPVETFLENVNFSERLIKQVASTDCSGFLYLSSLEVYGTSEYERILKENSIALFELHNIRNSYPLAKIAIEELLYMYFKEYGLPARIARLTQTFGPGIQYTDNRVFAQFARSVVENKNIVLKSKGETERNYCYISDAISAFFYILCRGKNGEAYNIANDNTYVNIYEFAKAFCKCNKEIDIEFQLQDCAKSGYLPLNKVKLDNSKLKSLGWQSENDIETMVKKFCEYFYRLRNEVLKDNY